MSHLNGESIPSESHVYRHKEIEIDVAVEYSDYGDNVRDVRVNGNYLLGNISDPVIAAILFHGLVRIYSEPYFDEVIYQTACQIEDGYLCHAVTRDIRGGSK